MPVNRSPTITEEPVIVLPSVSDENNNEQVIPATTTTDVLPLHVTDPFDLNESLAVGVTTVLFVVTIHYFLGSFSSASSSSTTGTKSIKSFRFFKAPSSSSSSTSSTENKKQDHIEDEDEDDEEEYRARIISFLHAVVSSIGSAYALYQHLDFNSNSVWLDIREATRLEANWQMFSFSYFACDTIMMITPIIAKKLSSITSSSNNNTREELLSDKQKQHQERKTKETITFLIHHMIAMASLACGSFFGIYGAIVCAAQLAGEISNPFMHLRWLLNADGQREHFLCRHLCTKMWYLTFFVSRMIISPYLAYFAMVVMHPVFWPQVWLMIIFSGKFIFDSWKADSKGEWWVG